MMSRQLPARPNLEHLRNQAKALLDDLRSIDPGSKLAAALHLIAREYGFSSWPKLKAHVRSLQVGGASTSPFVGLWIADVSRFDATSRESISERAMSFRPMGGR